MKGDKNIEDPVSRIRLRRKVLDRWENEGGRLCDDVTKPFQSIPLRKRKKKVPKVFPGISAAGNDNPPVGKSNPNKK